MLRLEKEIVKQFLIVFFLGLNCLFAQSLEPEIIKIAGTEESLEIGSQALIYLDKQSIYGINDLESSEFLSKFIKNKKDIPNTGYTDGSFWIKFKVDKLSEGDKDYFLEISNSSLDKIEFFYKEENTWKKKDAGDTYKFRERSFFYRFFLFPLEISKGKTETYFIKVQSMSSVNVPISIFPKIAVFSRLSLNEYFHWAFFGILFIMIFYNLFIFWGFREWSYLLYSFSTIFILLFYFGFNGYGYQYLWPENILLQNYIVPISIALSWVSIYGFGILFLELHKHSRSMYRIARAFIVINALIPLIMIYEIRIAVQIQNFFGIMNSIVMMLFGLLRWRIGNKSARLFTLGWSTLLIGNIFQILRVSGFIGSNFFTKYMMQIGSTTELVLLSLALSDKYRIIQDEYISMQKRLIHSQKRYNEELEEEVQKRTTELNLSLHTINKDLQVAGEIQKHAISVNLSEIKDLIVTPVYIPMSKVGGDFYGIHSISEKQYRIFIADATGHGVQAALITMAIKDVYDDIKFLNMNMSELLEAFNKKFFSRYMSLNSFVTCVLLDLDLKNHTIKYASAGHPSMVLIQEDKLKLLTKTGMMIGLREETKYDWNEVSFYPTDRLILFTDGIFEQFNDLEQEYGEERLHNFLLNSQKLPMKEVFDLLITDVDKFIGEGRNRQDDITIIGIEYKS